MAEVVILGSGTPVPVPGRAGSAVAVVGDDGWILVDCGRAATQRAIDAGLDLRSIAAVAITHHHSDHVSDLATLAIARWTAGATEPLPVVAPVGPSSRYTEACLDAYADQAFHSQAPDAAGPRPRLAVQAFVADAVPSTVFTSPPWKVSAALVDHHPVAPAVGYRIELGDRRVVISGDTAVCPGMRLLARDADVLVHEALLSERVAPSLLEWNAAARSVGELAAEARPRQLVLTHLIPAPGTPGDELAYLDEATLGGFAGPITVARDLVRIPLDD